MLPLVTCDIGTYSVVCYPLEQKPVVWYIDLIVYLLCFLLVSYYIPASPNFSTLLYLSLDKESILGLSTQQKLIHPSVHPSVHLSVHPSIHPSIHQSVHPLIYMYTKCIFLCFLV